MDEYVFIMVAVLVMSLFCAEWHETVILGIVLWIFGIAVGHFPIPWHLI